MNLQNCFKLIIGLLFLGQLMSCQPDAETPSNTILSENYQDGIFYQQHAEDAYEIEIRTNAPASFSRASPGPTFDIDPSGKTMVTLDPGAYFVDLEWEDGTKERLPIVIAKYVPEAKNAVSAMKNMSNNPDGYVLIFRHADSRDGEDIRDDSFPEWWKSCDPALARQMNDRGKQNSKRIGDGIRKLNIPLNKGISSEFCRARQTLEYMELDNLEVILDARLNHENANPKRPIFGDLNLIISENYEPNKVLVMVGHFNMMDQSPYLPFVEPFSMSDGFLMKRNSDGTQKFIGCIPLSYWNLF
jgi:phosphohistidine phosphatase SixA